MTHHNYLFAKYELENCIVKCHFVVLIQLFKYIVCLPLANSKSLCWKTPYIHSTSLGVLDTPYTPFRDGPGCTLTNIFGLKKKIWRRQAYNRTQLQTPSNGTYQYVNGKRLNNFRMVFGYCNCKYNLNIAISCGIKSEINYFRVKSNKVLEVFSYLLFMIRKYNNVRTFNEYYLSIIRPVYWIH